MNISKTITRAIAERRLAAIVLLAQLSAVGWQARKETRLIVYWTLFLVPALGALAERERAARGVKPSFILLLTFVFVVIAFRETGGDWQTYDLMFTLISRMSFVDAVQTTDPAYGALNWASSQLGWGLYGVNAACALIFLIGFARFCAPEGRPLLMLALATSYLIIVVAVGYTRQGTAIGIELIALRALMERRFFPFLFWIALAATFHRSAAVLLPLGYFAVPSRSGIMGRIAAGLATAAAVALFMTQLGGENDKTIAIYIQSDHYQSQGALIRSVMSVAAALVFLRNRRKWAGHWGDQDIWLVFSFTAVGLAGFSFVASTAADRLGLFVIPLQIIVFARIPVLWRSWGKAPVTGAIALYAAALGVWLHLGQFAGDLWLPYRSLIFGVIP